ncbi:hypothetical protein DL771_003961 [Monosporascus sp. 5C6A]|nr:hypothetical protein DL771_003961 [Monosporascus sp. 5C6A]
MHEPHFDTPTISEVDRFDVDLLLASRPRHLSSLSGDSIPDRGCDEYIDSNTIPPLYRHDSAPPYGIIIENATSDPLRGERNDDVHVIRDEKGRDGVDEDADDLEWGKRQKATRREEWRLAVHPPETQSGLDTTGKSANPSSEDRLQLSDTSAYVEEGLFFEGAYLNSKGAQVHRSWIKSDEEGSVDEPYEIATPNALEYNPFTNLLCKRFFGS